MSGAMPLGGGGLSAAAIAAATSKASPAGTELVPIDDAGTLKQSTAQAIANLATQVIDDSSNVVINGETGLIQRPEGGGLFSPVWNFRSQLTKFGYQTCSGDKWIDGTTVSLQQSFAAGCRAGQFAVGSACAYCGQDVGNFNYGDYNCVIGLESGSGITGSSNTLFGPQCAAGYIWVCGLHNAIFGFQTFGTGNGISFDVNGWPANSIGCITGTLASFVVPTAIDSGHRFATQITITLTANQTTKIRGITGGGFDGTSTTADLSTSNGRNALSADIAAKFAIGFPYTIKDCTANRGAVIESYDPDTGIWTIGAATSASTADGKQVKGINGADVSSPALNDCLEIYPPGSYNYNTMFGDFTGYRLRSGDHNVFLGFSAGSQQIECSDTLIIDSTGVHTSAANELIESLIVGHFSGGYPYYQWLRINGTLQLLSMTREETRAQNDSAGYGFLFIDSDTGKLTYGDPSGTRNYVVLDSTLTPPSGSTGNLQYNNGGAFGCIGEGKYIPLTVYGNLVGPFSTYNGKSPNQSQIWGIEHFQNQIYGLPDTGLSSGQVNRLFVVPSGSPAPWIPGIYTLSSYNATGGASYYPSGHQGSAIINPNPCTGVGQYGDPAGAVFGNGPQESLHTCYIGDNSTIPALSLPPFTPAATTGGHQRNVAEAVGTATAAATFTITPSPAIPTGSKILGVQLRVETTITSDGTTKTFTAAYSSGVTGTIGSGIAFSKSAGKASAIFDPNGASPITTGATVITITCDDGNFIAGGQVRAMIYYETMLTIVSAT